MKSVIRMLGIVLSLSLVFSCGKSTDDPASNGTRLSKVIEWTSYPQPVIDIFVFHYDDLNRVTEVTYSTGDSAKGESGAKYDYSTKWFYKGDEQLPYKSAGDVIANMPYEMYHFYDNNGNLVMDSSVSNGCNCYYLTKYHWFSDKVVTTLSSSQPNVPTTTSDSVAINGNNYQAVYLLNNHPNDQELPVSIFAYDN